MQRARVPISRGCAVPSRVLQSVHIAHHAHSLPVSCALPLGRVWRAGLAGEDRERAFAAAEVATLLNLRRALRNGTVSIEHSLAFRDRETLFIPQPLWEERAVHTIGGCHCRQTRRRFSSRWPSAPRPACHRLVPQANLFTRSLVEPNEFSSRELVAARAIACKGPSVVRFRPP